MKFGIGQAVPRTEDPRLLTGKGRYTDDVTMPGQAHAYFLRSPAAHATIRRLDVAAARTAPGVLGVFTAADLAADGIRPIQSHAKVNNRDGSPMNAVERPALADGTVRYVGEAVALVVAETAAQAKDAAEQIVFDFDPLPATVDPVAALEPGAPQIWPNAPGNQVFDWGLGEPAKVDAAFKKAAHVVSVDLVNNRVVASPMEPRGCLAAYDQQTGEFTFYVSSQGVHGLRKTLAKESFNLPEDRFHVITTDVGGGFGMKIFNYPEYVATLFAARRLGRPVKWSSERTEAFLSDDHGRDNVTHAELALDADYRFLGLRVRTIANLGAYLSNYGVFVATGAGNAMLPGLYRFGAVSSNVVGVFTNTQPVDAYRGAGRPEAAFVIERLVDKAARALKIAPEELRYRNYIRPEDMPYDTATGLTYDSGDFARNLREALELADRAGLPERKREAAARGRLRGLGIATYVEACAGGGAEYATVRVARTGHVTVLIGSQTNGQGHETAYKQIVATYLGVEPEQVTVIQGDSKLIAAGSGTGGSRSVPVGGAALAGSALRVQEKAKAAAAELMEAAAADIRFEEGRFTIVGTDRSMTLAEVAAASPNEVAFDEAGEWTPPTNTYPNGAHLCEVEIERETGAVTIVGYTVVDDFGRVMNPLMVAGQVHGGVAQGVGQALLEHTVFDPESGQLLSGSLMDYALPRADTLPFLRFKFNEVPCRTNALGMKGAGEAGAIGAPPAVINAIVDALAEFGVEHVDMPATPEKIWRLIPRETRLAAE